MGMAPALAHRQVGNWNSNHKNGEWNGIITWVLHL